MFKKIFFWEPSVSPHKTDLLDAMVSIFPDSRIVCVADHDISPDRIKLGWNVSKKLCEYEFIISPDDEYIESCFKSDDSFHFFSGIRHHKNILTALKFLKKYDRKFAIISEPRVKEGVLGVARYLDSIFTEKWIRRKVSFVLAIGRNGPPWFESVGYNGEKIFPFAYFVNGSKGGFLKTTDKKVIGFVGRIVKEKGILDLAAAMKSLMDFRLDIIGDGNLASKVRTSLCRYNINHNFYGVKCIGDVQKCMQSFDILILPSTTTDDGWGVVTNEALFSGSAVIASTCAGSSILLKNNYLGRTINRNSPEEIVLAVRSIESSGGFSDEFRNNRRIFAEKYLSGISGALYIHSIFDYIFNDGVRPDSFFK